MSKRKPKGGRPDGQSLRRHSKFGHPGTSPKARLQKKIDAERDERKAKKDPSMTDSVKKLFEGE